MLNAAVFYVYFNEKDALNVNCFVEIRTDCSLFPIDHVMFSFVV